jgi:hypothetical protein
VGDHSVPVSTALEPPFLRQEEDTRPQLIHIQTPIAPLTACTTNLYPSSAGMVLFVPWRGVVGEHLDGGVWEGFGVGIALSDF